MKKGLVIYGAWFFSDLIAELAAMLGWQVIGRVDPQPPIQMPSLEQFPPGAACFIAIGDNALRRYVTEQLETRSRKVVSLIHPTASISPSARIGRGSYIGEYAVARTSSVVGRGAVVNAGAVISHHTKIGDFVLLGPNAAIGSRANVGAGALVGAGAVIRPVCKVGEHCTVGAGAVVLENIARENTVVGIPARSRGFSAARKQGRQSDWESNVVW